MSTPNYSWITPTVASDLNIWGGKLNTIFGLQDALVRQLENCNIGVAAPSTVQNGTLWLDTSGVNPQVLRIYDGAQWVAIGNLSTSAHTFTTISPSADSIGDYKISLQTANHGSWLLCDGSAISRTTYATLYALGGGASTWPFGQGDLTTTFNLPDLRGLVAAAQGLNTNAAFSPPLSTRTNGQYLGEETHKLLSTELPDPITSTAPLGVFAAGGIGAIQSFGTGSSGIIANTGGGQRHNVMQPTLIAGNYFIYTGV